MRLRTRTLVIVGGTVAALFALLFFAARFALTSEYDALESRAAIKDVARVENALSDEVRQLARVVGDWAPRDETYRYMEGRNPAFVVGSLTDEALSNLGANVVLFLDEEGRAVHVEAVDLDLGVRTEPDTATVSALLAADFLRSPGDPRGDVSGLMAVPGGVMLVAAHPITSGDMYAAPNGTMVLGRLLDRTALDRLEAVTGLTIQAYPLAGSLPASVERARAARAGGSASWSEPESEEILGGYSLIDDVSADPVLALRVRIPREIRAQGARAVAYMGISMLIVGLLATATVILVIDRGVLSRLSRLTRELATIAAGHDSTARVTVTGGDELATLASNINDALAAGSDAEEELRAARDALEVRVHDRTAELRESESRYRMLIERMADAVFCADNEGAITFVNSRASELTRIPVDVLAGMSFTELLTASSAQEVERVRSTVNVQSTVVLEVGMRIDGGDAIPVELRAAPMVDEAGHVIGMQWIAHDIAQRKRYEQDLLHVATHDHLTGLFNRRFFEEALELRLAEARRSGGCGAILWIDIDDFKDVNDTLGHRVGDEVLVEFGDHLRQQVREYNVLARLGGDEFGILLPGIEPDEAVSAAHRILTSVNSRTFSASEHALRLGVSMGVVVYPTHGTTIEELLAKADVAMYAAKAAGRSRVHVHQVDERGSEDFSHRLQWNERIVDALRGEEFLVYAQPLLDVKAGRVCRHELLIRMTDEQGEVVAPVEFLPAAERLGLIRDIDRWMVSQAVILLQEHPDSKLEIDVNLSGKAFGDPDLLPVIASAIDEGGIEPRRLGFEITETAAVADILRAQEFICTLSDLGCRFSLDDFGSGFSSFYYLRHLPIDCLKVDGSFIRGLAHSDQDRHLVRGMVELCRGLGVEVVAEYVENAEILAVVEELGMDYAQGYHIGKPGPAREMIAKANCCEED